jgi:hypothetical protein
VAGTRRDRKAGGAQSGGLTCVFRNRHRDPRLVCTSQCRHVRRGAIWEQCSG